MGGQAALTNGSGSTKGGVSKLFCKSSAPKNKFEHCEKADVCIVGGGFGGAYCAYQLKKAHPELKVVLLEKLDFLGGRLLSDDNDEDNDTNKDELGGMRVFPSVQPKVESIIKEVGLHLSPIRLNDRDNWFYYKGERTRKKDVKMNGKSPREIVSQCEAKFAEMMPEEAKKEPFESKELRNLSLPDFLRKYGATNEEIEFFFSYSGYDLFRNPDVQASIFFEEAKLYNSTLDEDQRYVKEGFQEVVRRLAKLSNCDVRFECEVVKVVPHDKKQPSSDPRRRVTYVDKQNKKQKLIANHVIISVPADVLSLMERGIKGISKERRQHIAHSVTAMPLFKVFLEWERVPGKEQWWKAEGFFQGKSTSDLDVRQLHYYDNEDLLCYVSANYARIWKDRFEKNPRQAAQMVFDQIKQIHGLDNIPEPDWESTIFKYWVSGSHKWRRGVDIKRAIPAIADGLADNSNIYIAGDAYSKSQGWVAGVIETADVCLQKILKQL